MPKWTHFCSSMETPNSYSYIKRKRSAEAAELSCEPETSPKKSGKHTAEPSGSYRIMTAQEDRLIWKRYQAHQKEARNRGLKKKASSGITSQIAKELQTNRQTITARLNVLRSKHATIEQSEHEDRNSDVHSLQCDILPKHLLQEDAKSRMTEGEAYWSGGDDYWAETFPGFCYNQHTNKTPLPRESNNSSSSTGAVSSASTSATGSASRRVEAPLAPTPHITRKSTFSPQDDIILWNAYIRNDCQVLAEAQCTGLMKRLRRSNTSCLEYRMRRLVAEDQGVPMDDIQKCAFTPTDDAHILRLYHANNALSTTKQRTEEALCRDLSQQVQHESVRVLYRLHYLLNHYETAAEPQVHWAPKAKDIKNMDNEAEFEGDNESDAASKDEDSDYKHAAKGRATRETSYFTRHNKKRFYTEEEDMVIWTAYLSASSDIERNNALRKVFIFGSNSLLCCFFKYKSLFYIINIHLSCIVFTSPGWFGAQSIFERSAESPAKTVE